MQKITYTGEGIGTLRCIDFFSSTEKGEEISQAISTLIAEFDDKYSRFKPTSLVGIVNTTRKLETDDEDFAHMIQLGVEYEQKTSGLFSLFVGTALERIGYGKELAPKVQSSGIQEESYITKEHNLYTLYGTKNIDLGGLGKGYLISLIEKLLQEYAVNIYRINGGGDIAISQPSYDVFGSILLQNPLNQEQSIGAIDLLQGGCCSSGLLHRRRKHDQKDVHHLIDTQTQTSVETPIVGLFILHESVLIADIAATSLFVTPIDKIEDMAATLGVEYMLVFGDLSVLRSPGFPLKTEESSVYM